MASVHEAVGVVVVAVFAVGWLWGLGAWAARRGPGRWFWTWLAVTQVLVVLQAVIGVVLFAMGRRADSWLHYAYGIFPVLVLVVAHVVARETRTMKPSPRTGRTMEPW